MGRRLLLTLALVAGGVLAWSAPALAQESKKFNAKQLETAYQLPVYAPKNAVVGNEVVETVSEYDSARNAIYSVRGDLKKALEFFTSALGEPKKEESDTGTVTYTFVKSDPNDPKIRRKVKLHVENHETKQLQISLTVRKYSSASDADD